MKRSLHILFLVIPLLLPDGILAQQLCSGFGQDGLAVSLESNTTHYNAILPLPDGKFIVAGYVERGDKDFFVSRFHANGSPDVSFGNAGSQTYDLTGARKDDVAQSLAIASDGSVLVGGYSNGYGTIIKLASNGSLQNSFGSAGKVVYPGLYSSVDALLVSPAGIIYGVGKGFDTENIVIRRLGVRAFNPDGTSLGSFGEEGQYINYEQLIWHEDDFNAVLQDDGKILVSSSFSGANDVDRWRVIRVNANGTSDLSFGTNGLFEELEPSAGKMTAIRLLSNSILVAGFTSENDGSGAFTKVKKLSANGAPDHGFGSAGSATHNGAGTHSRIFAFDLDNAGNIYFAGSKMDGDGKRDFLLAGFSSTGSDNTSFGVHIDRPEGTDGGELLDLARLDDGSFLTCGYAQGRDHKYGVVLKYNPDGTLSDSFKDGGTVFGRSAGEYVLRTVAVQTDGKIVAAGSYTIASSNTGLTLSRFLSDGSPDLSFGSYGYVRVNLDQEREYFSQLHVYANGKILAAGNLEHPVRGWDFLLARFKADGSLDETFGTSGVAIQHVGAFGKNNTLNAIEVDGEGRILIAGDANYLGGSYGDATLVRLLPDGTLDSSFGTSGVARVTLTSVNDYFTDVAIASDGSLFVTGYATVNKGGMVAKFTSSGQLVQSFGTEGVTYLPWNDADEHVRPFHIRLQDDGKLVLGCIEKDIDDVFDGQALVYRLLPSGEPDNTFGTSGVLSLFLFGSGSDTVRELLLDNEGNYLLSGHLSGSQSGLYLAKVGVDGTEYEPHFVVPELDSEGGIAINRTTGNVYAAVVIQNTHAGAIACIGAAGSGGDCTGVAQPVITQVGETLETAEADSYQWFLDGEMLPGEDDQFIFVDPANPGSYSVEVTIGGCVLMSESFNYLVTSVSPEGNLLIRMYPNPVIDEIRIESASDLSGSRVLLMSPYGAEISKLDGARGNSAILPVSDLAPGIYILTIRSRHGESVFRILKTH